MNGTFLAKAECIGDLTGESISGDGILLRGDREEIRKAAALYAASVEGKVVPIHFGPMFDAAPELLSALERVGCQDRGSCGPDEVDGRCFVCAAIAKARGVE